MCNGGSFRQCHQPGRTEGPDAEHYPPSPTGLNAFVSALLCVCVLCVFQMTVDWDDELRKLNANEGRKYMANRDSNKSKDGNEDMGKWVESGARKAKSKAQEAQYQVRFVRGLFFVCRFFRGFVIWPRRVLCAAGCTPRMRMHGRR